MYRLPTLVPLVYYCNGTGTRETKRASERACGGKCRDVRGSGTDGLCPGCGCVMACVVVEGETGLLGQQYVPEAQAHRTEGAHVSVRARGMKQGDRGDVYYMILIHIYPYVALNAACEMSRAGA